MLEQIFLKIHRLRDIRYKWDRLLELTLLPVLRGISNRYFFITYPRKIELKTIQKILIIALNKGIGDAVLYSPALNILRKSFPNARIVIVVNSYVKELVQRFHSVDEWIPYDHKKMNIREKIRIIQSIRKRGFDLTFDLMYYKFLESALLTFFSGTKYTVGFDQGFRGLFFSHPYKPEFENTHAVDLILGLVRSIGIPREPFVIFERLESNEYENAFSSRLFEENNIKERDLVIGIQTGAHDGIDEVDKRWSAGGFSQLADYLIKQYKATILLLGDPSESERGEGIIYAMESSPINLIGKTTIGELIAILKKCNLLICSNSGLLHMAIALNIPTLSFGGVNLNRWGPYIKNGKHTVLTPNEKTASFGNRKKLSLETIPVEMAIEAVEKQFSSISWLNEYK